MNRIKILFVYSLMFISCSLLFVGCGHTMFHKVEGTGVYARIPLPNGSSLIEAAVGDMVISSGILRGGATLDENTSKGGTFGSVSIGRHTHISTVPALNEGNIRDVLTSKDTDPKTKQLLAQYLITRQSPETPSSAVTAINAGSATGDKNTTPEVKATKTGIDNVVDNVAETTPKIVTPIVQSSENVAKHVSTVVGDKSESVIKSFMSKSYIIIIAVIILLIIIAVIVLIIVKKKSKSKIDIVKDTVDVVKTVIVPETKEENTVNKTE